jgi:hypothetical protein
LVCSGEGVRGMRGGEGGMDWAANLNKRVADGGWRMADGGWRMGGPDDDCSFRDGLETSCGGEGTA